jgi:excisionase family DNA binding protein
MDSNQQPVEEKNPRLISINEAAKILDVCPRTIFRLIASGQMPAPIKVGRSSKMIRKEVEDYIDKLITERDRLNRLFLSRR